MKHARHLAQERREILAAHGAHVVDHVLASPTTSTAAARASAAMAGSFTVGRLWR